MHNVANLDKCRFAYEVLLQRIVRGEYGPGYRLVIDQIARELGISPTPVREAIRQLEAEGVVVYNRHSGPRVALIDDRTYPQVLKVLAVLEGFATAQAAARLRPNDIAELQALNQQMKEAIRRLDFALFNELNRQFHQTIYQHCGNAYLREVLEGTWRRLDTLRRNIFAFIPSRAPKSVEEHDTLIELIQRQASAEMVERFARQHKLHMLQAFLEWKARGSAPMGEADWSKTAEGWRS